jgi:acetolactate synthase-1/2/3 large subunit
MIRAGQAMAGEVFGTDLPSQDYAAVARSFGLEGKRVTRKEDIGPTFKEMFNSGKAGVMDIVTDPDSIPDSLMSFARVEFDGASMPPSKLVGALRKKKLKDLDIRLLNLVKFIAKTW